MEKKVIITIVKELWFKLVDYVKLELLDKLKEASLKAFEAFKETLWNEIKDEVHACAVELITDAETFLGSTEAQEKEELILDALMDKIKLPFVLKPFKGLIRKIIKGKLEEFIKNTIEKGKEFIG